ncbi:hypothetical protein BD413DRAFT_590761 [Trametes elegans]|nr:hypothetical protein BD413DRAFT_590761 [Trametes elegans]
MIQAASLPFAADRASAVSRRAVRRSAGAEPTSLRLSAPWAKTGISPGAPSARRCGDSSGMPGRDGSYRGAQCGRMGVVRCAGAEHL